jgi:hypothetical protein
LNASNLLSLVALAQAFYFSLTGIWPLVSMATFEAVTGPKFDDWLVKTVGVLVSVIGGVLAVAGLRRAITLEILLLAVGSAVALAGIDVVYVAKRRISPVYLLDALAEVILIALWIFAWTIKHRQQATQSNDASAFSSPIR